MNCGGPALPAEVINIQHGSLIDNNPITLGQNTSMTFLYIDGSIHGTSFNKNTLVARLDLGQVRVLLTGDAEAGQRLAPSNPPATNSIEAALLLCCASELRADILVTAHHGSKTSSRTRFLDAVGANIFAVSSGPKKYGSVTLPDSEIITELESRGQVFRTNQDDDACGPDNDDRAGGCDNIRILITAGSPPQASYLHLSD